MKAQLCVSSSDYDSLHQRCFECRATLKLLEQLVQVSDGFHDVQNLVTTKSFHEATQVHASVNDIITDIDETYGSDIAIFQCLLRKQTALEDQLEKCVVHRWRELITWSSFQTVLTIASGPSAHQELQQLSQSLQNLGCLSTVVAKFARQIMTQIVNKLLTDSDTVYDLDIKENTSSMSVSFKVVTVAPGMRRHGVVLTVRKLEMFMAMMEALYENFLNIHVIDEVSAARHTTKDNVSSTKDLRDGLAAAGSENDAVMSSSDVSLMSIFGEECSATCLQGLISGCLSSAVPSRRSELSQFSQVTSVVEELQRKLVAFGFIADDNKMMVDYVRNVDVLFANKRCVELLDEARKLIMSDIHNIVQVSHNIVQVIHKFTTLYR